MIKELSYSLGDIILFNRVDCIPIYPKLIVAKRKKIENKVGQYDYLGVGDISLTIIKDSFYECMIGEKLTLQDVIMPKIKSKYNTDKKIGNLYFKMKSNFTRIPYSDAFDFISQELYIKIVKQIIKNTFKETP